MNIKPIFGAVLFGIPFAFNVLCSSPKITSEGFEDVIGGIYAARTDSGISFVYAPAENKRTLYIGGEAFEDSISSPVLVDWATRTRKPYQMDCSEQERNKSILSKGACRRADRTFLNYAQYRKWQFKDEKRETATLESLYEKWKTENEKQKRGRGWIPFSLEEIFPLFPPDIE